MYFIMILSHCIHSLHSRHLRGKGDERARKIEEKRGKGREGRSVGLGILHFHPLSALPSAISPPLPPFFFNFPCAFLLCRPLHPHLSHFILFCPILYHIIQPIPSHSIHFFNSVQSLLAHQPHISLHFNQFL